MSQEKEVAAWRDRFPAYEYRPVDECIALKLKQPPSGQSAAPNSSKISNGSIIQPAAASGGVNHE